MRANFKDILLFIIIYLVSVIAIYALFYLSEKFKDPLTLSFIFSALILLIVLIIFRKIRTGKFYFEGKESLRYTMLCKKCGWEWMSHTTQTMPNKCPNCGEKTRLEIVGWRKVKVLTKQDRDLRGFFKLK